MPALLFCLPTLLQVQVWGELGAAVYSQLKAVDTVSVVGELRVDYRRVGGLDGVFL
jgi:hypothetical protein